jgi:hypothetical protein
VGRRENVGLFLCMFQVREGSCLVSRLSYNFKSLFIFAVVCCGATGHAKCVIYLTNTPAYGKFDKYILIIKLFKYSYLLAILPLVSMWPVVAFSHCKLAK